MEPDLFDRFIVNFVAFSLNSGVPFVSGIQ